MDRVEVLPVEKPGVKGERPNFVLSTVALIFGGFMITCGGMTLVTEKTPILQFSTIHGMSAYGVPALFGALAYRSAKRRRLNLVRSSSVRIGVEALLVGVALLPPLLALVSSPGSLLSALYSGPASILIPIAWVIVAYYSACAGVTVERLFGRAAR